MLDRTFQGYVQSVTEDSFWAIFYENQKYKFDAEILKTKLNEEDRELLCEGAYIEWTIKGSEENPDSCIYLINPLEGDNL